MAVRREEFLASGGFDDDYFAYLEDVDFGWRQWIFGRRIIAEPRAVARHRGGATGEALGIFSRGFLFEKNAFATVYKNLERRRVPRPDAGGRDDVRDARGADAGQAQPRRRGARARSLRRAGRAALLRAAALRDRGGDRRAHPRGRSADARAPARPVLDPPPPRGAGREAAGGAGRTAAHRTPRSSRSSRCGSCPRTRATSASTSDFFAPFFESAPALVRTTLAEIFEAGA